VKKLVTYLGAAALTITAAHAGGIDRARLSYGTLFEKGNYIEFGASHVSPKVSGTFNNPAFGPFSGTSTGDAIGSYSTFSFAYKRDINEKLAFAIFVNTPYGASANFSSFPYTGLQADWESKQVAVLLKYKVAPSTSVYGGLRVVRSQASITVPDLLIRGGLGQAAQAGSTAAAGIIGASGPGTLDYSASSNTDTRVGYVLGAAYEKPEIALRIGLTYESRITHKFATTENIASSTAAAVSAAFSSTGVTEITLPQTLTLDVQSGVAKDTLVFGSIRWSEYSVWAVRPPGFGALLSSNITDFKNDVFTYQVGVGRKLNDTFSVFARVGYEKSNGGIASRLSPTDGLKSVGIGGTYTKGNMKVAAGLEYVELGDAVDGSGTVFEGNDAVGFGMSVGYRF
jgi:long-chain fatty acid transport protein